MYLGLGCLALPHAVLAGILGGALSFRPEAGRACLRIMLPAVQLGAPSVYVSLALQLSQDSAVHLWATRSAHHAHP